jgi:hypothetical protein
VLQRALRKQKKKQNERLVRSTLAASADATKADGNSSDDEEDLTVECVPAAAAAVAIAARRLTASSPDMSLISFVYCTEFSSPIFTLSAPPNPPLQIYSQRCRHQPSRPELRALEKRVRAFSTQRRGAAA